MRCLYVHLLQIIGYRKANYTINTTLHADINWFSLNFVRYPIYRKMFQTKVTHFNGIRSLTHGAEPFLRSRQLCSYSRTSQHFMEPEGSSSCSQEPSTGPYPEPDQSKWDTLRFTSVLHNPTKFRLSFILGS
jgi:hypothetical protein